jgi:hypothetical protein
MEDVTKTFWKSTVAIFKSAAEALEQRANRARARRLAEMNLFIDQWHDGRMMPHGYRHYQPKTVRYYGE